MRKILEKSGIIQDGDTITTAVIEQFKSNREHAVKLYEEIEKVTLHYKEITEEIGREQGKKTELQRERQLTGTQIEEIIRIYSDHENGPDLEKILLSFQELEECRAASIDYELRLKHLENLSRDLHGQIEEIPSLEEKIENMEESITLRESDMKACTETLAMLGETIEQDMKELYYPLLITQVKILLKRDEWKFFKHEQILLTLLGEMEMDKPGFSGESVNIGMLYALCKALLIDYFSKDSEEYPILFDNLLPYDEKENLKESLKFLIAISKTIQVIYIIRNSDAWQSLKESLTELGKPYSESRTGRFTLLTA